MGCRLQVWQSRFVRVEVSYGWSKVVDGREEGGKGGRGGKRGKKRVVKERAVKERVVKEEWWARYVSLTEQCLGEGLNRVKGIGKYVRYTMRSVRPNTRPRESTATLWLGTSRSSCKKSGIENSSFEAFKARNPPAYFSFEVGT